MSEMILISKDEYERLKGRPPMPWRIMRTTDGLYSSGGLRPRFTKLGKGWSRRSHLTNHLRQLVADRNRYNSLTREIMNLSWQARASGDVAEHAELNRNMSDVRKAWSRRQWYHPEEFLPACWVVVDPDGSQLTIAEFFKDMLPHHDDRRSYSSRKLREGVTWPE